MTTKKRTPWITCVKQIAAGAHADGCGEGGGQASLSSYGSLEELLASHGDEIVEGAWVVDGRSVTITDAYRVSMHGPMTDGKAGVDDVWGGDHYDLPTGFFPDVILDNYGMGGMATAQRAAKATGHSRPGPFDQVPPSKAAELWAEVGATVGRWRNGQVEWQVPAPVAVETAEQVPLF